MTIQEIKSGINILELAFHLGIKVDPKTKKALCPFHDDKNPSLQFSEKKQIVTCFSSRCDAGTMDVIKLTEKYLKKNTAEAIQYLKEYLGEPKKEIPNYAEMLKDMQRSYRASKLGREYAKSRNVQNEELGYNKWKDGKYHELRGCITFGLKDEFGKVVSLYGRSILEGNNKHFYTKNRRGLYPQYPNVKARKVLLVESVIDAATLINTEIIKDFEILALYGVNGLTSEHLRALQNIENLDEVVLFFDGDEAGREAVKKQGKYLLEVLETKISVVDCPDGEDVNSLLEGHEEGIFTELLNNRKEFFLSNEPPQAVEEKEEIKLPELNTRNPHKIKYETSVADYFIQGGIRKELDSLKVTLVIAHKESRVKSRNKLDLYEDKQSEKVAREAAEKLNLRADLIEYDLSRLVDLLDEYRESGKTETPIKKEISKIEEEKCLGFLKQPQLIKAINKKIGESGVVGEENNRVFLFTIASSHKMRDTMHALIQGSSGSGKTHLLASIMSLIPKEDRISLTRVTESSFYNYGEYFLRHKLIGIEDYEGLEEKAELAFRELQSKGSISSSTSVKDEYTGGNTGTIKWVYGPIASMSATTQGAIYEDNMSRCFLIAVDESEEQTQRIIKYQNQKAIGKIEEDNEKEAKLFIQNCVKLLKPYKVINPYADKIELPREAHKIRRLNELFQSFIRQLTLINQYQRKRDSQGRLITAKEDIEVAIEIMFDSIVLKVDELDGSLRMFYEKLKDYVLKKGKEYEFSQREVRQLLRLSKSQIQRYMNDLIELEYVFKSYVGARNTFHYKIAYWDNLAALRARIQKDLNSQLLKIS